MNFKNFIILPPVREVGEVEEGAPFSPANTWFLSPNPALFNASNSDVWRPIRRSERSETARWIWPADMRVPLLCLMLFNAPNPCMSMPQTLMYGRRH